jgi:two-component system CheB/CheR fusion protein
VVGVGASHGGVDALLALLPHLQPGGGAAYVVAMHLAGAAESHLPAVLARASPLPVREVTAAVVPLAGHVYVLPPQWGLVLREGRLTLVSPGPQRPARPIDALLRSLAAGLGPRASGVVLSGEGDDGTDGLAAVGARGGATYVQVPWLAAHPGMPRSALPYARYCLTLEELGVALSRHAAPPP